MEPDNLARSIRSFKFSPEVLDNILDCADDASLLAFSEAWRYALQKSRQRIFRDLTFRKDDEGFDAYLGLISHPHCTISGALKRLHLDGLFSPDYPHEYQNLEYSDLHTKFTSLESLWYGNITWHVAPKEIRSILALPWVVELRLECQYMPYMHFWSLIENMSKKNRGISLYAQELYDNGQDIPPSTLEAAFNRRLHFSSLDAVSLMCFQDGWSPRLDKEFDVTADTFRLNIHVMPMEDVERFIPFLRRFLERIGISITKLIIEVPDTEKQWLFYHQLNLSNCVNVRAIHAAFIYTGKGYEQDLARLWTMFRNIPSQKIESVVLFFDIDAFVFFFEDKMRSVPWLSFYEEACRIFPSLKRMRMEVGGRGPSQEMIQDELDFVLQRDFRQKEGAPKLNLKACDWTPETANPYGLQGRLWWTRVEQEEPLVGDGTELWWTVDGLFRQTSVVGDVSLDGQSKISKPSPQI